MEVVEQVDYAGEQAYKVKLVRNNDRVQYEFFSTTSGLLLGSQTTVPTPMGDIDLDVRISDYKQFGKVKFPTKVTREQAGQEMTITFSDITFDNVDASAFAIPEAVKALMKP